MDGVEATGLIRTKHQRFSDCTDQFPGKGLVQKRFRRCDQLSIEKYRAEDMVIAVRAAHHGPRARSEAAQALIYAVRVPKPLAMI
jgi:alpha-D-ribose 1-methylphosphonate 5-phosphate C-P lyase